MASLNSSVIFWNETEIVPRSLLFISSGAVGERLLFWHPSPNSNVQQELIRGIKSVDKTRQKNPPNTEANSTPQYNAKLYSSPAGAQSFHMTTSRSAYVDSSTHSNTSFGETSLPDGFLSAKARPSAYTASMGQRHSTLSSIANTPATSAINSNTGGASVVNPTELVIEGVPVSSLLSLFHSSTNELQSKIYVKLRNIVFVGVTFSLIKSVMATNGVAVSTHSSPVISRKSLLHSANFFTSTLASHLSTDIDFLHPTCPSNLSNDARTQTPVAYTERVPLGGCGKQPRKFISQSVSSFSIVFVLNEAAPPCVQSHYTELARLTGSQMRRSELYWQLLSSEREKISAILDRFAGIISSGESGGGTDVGSEDANDDNTSGGDNEGNDTSSSSYFLTTKRTNLEPQEGCDSAEFDGRESVECASDPRHVYAHIAKRSPLCNDLAQILEQVSSTGRVNVKICNRYSVFFCLPFKAYSIMPFGLKMITTPKPCWPAIRPGAVWRSMQRLRPYHTLLLTTRKRFLRRNAENFPADVNPSLESFVEDISPVSSLNTMSGRGHSQESCLRAAHWLVYHGHAIIISPITTNSAYILAPLSHLWLQPNVFLQFAAQFPRLDFAEVLSSFSTYFTLQEHFDGKSSAKFWVGLAATECVDLIAWLLRRRLIIQLHTYMVSRLPCSARKQFAASNGEGDVCETDYTQQSVTTESMFIRIHKGCGGDLLRRALPNEADQEEVLDYYCCRIQNSPDTLYLFLRILTRLPAHIEELMFVESVDRKTLIHCFQLFSPFVIKFQLPDPVTACFVGVEWPN